MRVLDKIKAFDEHKEKVRKLQAELDRDKQEKEKLEARLSTCQNARVALSDAKAHNKKGIIGLVIGVLLIIVEILCLTGTFGEKYRGFGFIDIIIIAIPLLLAVKNFARGKGARKYGSDEELTEEIRLLLQKLEPFYGKEETLGEELNALEYTGEDWDLSVFLGNPADVKQLENDFADLLLVLKYKENDADFATNCWLAKNEMKSSLATYKGDKETAEKYTRASEALRASNSWPLLLINAVNISLTMELAMAALGTYGEGIPFTEALERTHVRKPENEDEQALWDLAHEVIPDFLFEVGYALRKAMGK